MHNNKKVTLVLYLGIFDDTLNMQPRSMKKYGLF